MSCGPSLTPPNDAKWQPTGLCTQCRALQLHDIDPDQISASKKYELEYERHDSIPGLPLIAQSAAAGCGVCRMLHSEITDALAHLDEPGPIKICGVVVKFYENEMRFQVEFQGGETTVHFYTAADPGLQGFEKLGITQKHVPEVLFSPAGLSNVRNFINQALERSPPPNEIATLPTRLIDVGGRPDQEDPRLIIPSEHPPLRDSAPTDVSQRRYIALSYCWGTPHTGGGSQLLKTETFNLAEFQQRIPLALFPAALLDAILLTRRVCGGAVRYIWIDALCIVQDDRADWEREAARMASVYQNAYLTFCSTQGSCGDSFAMRPNETAEVPFSRHLGGAAGIDGSYHLTRWMAENFEWDSRGWTMQEIYFSPRALLFSAMQTYLWDTHSAAEADEDGFRVPGEAVFQPESQRQWWAEQVIEGRSWRLDDNDDDPDDEAADAERKRKRLYENWYGKMIAYSRRTLTFAADRLPAISALASRMQAKFDALTPASSASSASSSLRETYVAGLWSRDLPAGLLWSVPVFDADPAPSFADYLAQRTDRELFVAPSWSWACQDETAFFHGHGADFTALGAVERVAVEPAGLDAFGRVSGGEVVVGGWMARVPWAYFEVNQADREGMNYEAVRRDGGVRTGPAAIRLVAPGGGGEAEVEFYWWVEDERHAEYWPSGTFAVLLLGMSVYPEELVPASPEEGWGLFQKATGVNGEPGCREVVREDGVVARFDSIFVLGIVLHETEEPGVYLRAGYMRGSAFEDTLAELRDAKYRTVRII